MELILFYRYVTNISIIPTHFKRPVSDLEMTPVMRSRA